jgi:hypothetical protein
MQRTLLLGALALAACLHASEASGIVYPQNGTIGVYADAPGTTCCLNVPTGSAVTLHVIATTGGASSAGITGAEFRIELSPTQPGAVLAWTASAAANVVLGNPIDNSSAAGDLSGLNIAFGTCQKQAGMAGDHILLGTILAFNITGERALLVKKHNRPSNPNLQAPLFTLCDKPVFTAVPLTLLEGDPILLGQEATAFRSPVNSASCSGGTCGTVGTEGRTWSALKGLYR